MSSLQAPTSKNSHSKQARSPRYSPELNPSKPAETEESKQMGVIPLVIDDANVNLTENAF